MEEEQNTNTEQNNDTNQPVQELSGKEAYEARKAEKMKKKNSEKKSLESKKNTKSFVKWGVWIIALGLVVWGVISISGGSTPLTEDMSVFYESQGRNHVLASEINFEYNSNPPTSGDHDPVPAKTGFREEAIHDGHLIHSLEHGLVWISYNPNTISPAILDELRDFRDPFVVITARPENDTDIAVAAWTRLDKFNVEDDIFPEQRVRDFISRYKNKGPEYIPPGSHGGI